MMSSRDANKGLLKVVGVEPSASSVAGVRISHPDRLIYPELGISKIELARYYERIGSWMLPRVAGRPLTLVHRPEGLSGRCNYLKHAKAWGPGALRRVQIQEKTKVGEYLVVDSIEAVVSLAQMGIVEIHTWNCLPTTSIARTGWHGTWILDRRFIMEAHREGRGTRTRCPRDIGFDIMGQDDWWARVARRRSPQAETHGLQMSRFFSRSKRGNRRATRPVVGLS